MQKRYNAAACRNTETPGTLTEPPDVGDRLTATTERWLSLWKTMGEVRLDWGNGRYQVELYTRRDVIRGKSTVNPYRTMGFNNLKRSCWSHRLKKMWLQYPYKKIVPNCPRSGFAHPCFIHNPTSININLEPAADTSKTITSFDSYGTMDKTLIRYHRFKSENDIYTMLCTSNSFQN